MAQMVKNLPAMQETQIQSLGQEDPLEKGMATLSSILAWRIPRTEEPGTLQSKRSQRVGHDWATNTLTFTFHTHTHTYTRLFSSVQFSRSVMSAIKKKKKNNVICSNMGRPRHYHTKWRKSDRERQIPHITYMWNLKNKTNELIYKTETDSQTEKTNLWVPKGKEEGKG